MTLYIFLAGASLFGFLMCALLFFRFWWRSNDQLFLAFALAFALLGIGQGVQVLANIPTEEREYIYLFRLAAFSIIIVAILRKNLRPA